MNATNEPNTWGGQAGCRPKGSPGMTTRRQQFGDEALIEYVDPGEVLRVAAVARAHDALADVEVIAGADCIVLRASPRASADHSAWSSALNEVRGSLDKHGHEAMHTSAIRIDVAYDGDDLDQVADATGLSVVEVIARHSEAEYLAAFAGFSPGFTYLTGLDPVLALPRRDTPRTSVPAGSVAIAVGYSAVYPRTSPGGWHLIGHTTAVLFDPHSDPPALLTPGTRVHFRPVRPQVTAVDPAVVLDPSSTQTARAGQERAQEHEHDFHTHEHEIHARDHRAHHGDQHTASALRVTSAGPLALVVDQGRPGWADSGVGRSGAYDRGALCEANAAVGNQLDAAAIEVTVGPFRFEPLEPMTVAVGGPAELRVDRVSGVAGHANSQAMGNQAMGNQAMGNTDHGSQEMSLDFGDDMTLDLEHDPHSSTTTIASGQAVTLPAGTTAQVRVLAPGVRGYLAVRGGIDAEPVLGSRSRDTLAALGPMPLAPADEVPIGESAEAADTTSEAAGTPGASPRAESGRPRPTERSMTSPGAEDSPTAPVRLRMRPGPDAADAPAIVNAVLGMDWVVSPACDRIGLRLKPTDSDTVGATASEWPASWRERPSRPTFRGCVQLPPDGGPILLGPDAPTTGGYPVIAVLDAASSDACAQLRPGALVRFEQAPATGE